MAEITAKRQGELLRTLFGVLSEVDDAIPAKQAIAAVEKRML